MTSIILSAAASNYIKKMIEKKQGIGLRLSIKKTGCSGYAYAPMVISKVNAADIAIEEQGLKIFIDSTWTHLLEDVQVDYIIDEKSGLKQKRLVFTNPKEKNRCGCGESFQIEPEQHA